MMHYIFFKFEKKPQDVVPLDLPPWLVYAHTLGYLLGWGYERPV